MVVVQMAFLMAACASLEVAQEDTETSRGSAGLAHRMVQKYKSTAAAIASMHASSGSLANSKADKSLYFMLIMVRPTWAALYTSLPT